MPPQHKRRAVVRSIACVCLHERGMDVEVRAQNGEDIFVNE